VFITEIQFKEEEILGDAYISLLTVVKGHKEYTLVELEFIWCSSLAYCFPSVQVSTGTS